MLASSVPRDVVDEVVAVTGRQAKRSDGRLPPHVMVYFTMAMALFVEEDYEEVAVRLTETLSGWGRWDDRWAAPTSGGITQARQRLGYEPVKELFAQVVVPGGGGVDPRGDAGVMAVDGDRRVRVGCPGQQGERRGVRLCWVQCGHLRSQGAGRHRQRVRLAEPTCADQDGCSGPRARTFKTHRPPRTPPPRRPGALSP
ncbi:transposase domain-containing protein [Actinophytocola sp.]|uniref:transposase domain-containing protein n=1 Tax=Actinophytocola sp. TaxID=1872138 RepID=UPI00345C00FA